MSEPVFHQAERRSFLMPVLLALVFLAAAIALAIHFFPVKTVGVAHIHTDLLPTHTVFKSQSIVLGQDQSEDVLFVATSVQVENRMRIPVSLEDFSVTLTDTSGAELTERSVKPEDLANLEMTFPGIKPIAGTPLLRDTELQPGQTAQGTLIFSLPISKDLWDSRKDATVKVDVYHQEPAFQVIPKT